MAYNRAGGPRKGRKKVCVFCVEKLMKSTTKMLQDLRDLYQKDQRFFLVV